MATVEDDNLFIACIKSLLELGVYDYLGQCGGIFEAQDCSAMSDDCEDGDCVLAVEPNPVRIEVEPGLVKRYRCTIRMSTRCHCHCVSPSPTPSRSPPPMDITKASPYPTATRCSGGFC